MTYQIADVKDWNKWDEDAKKPGKRLGTIYSIVKRKMKGPVIIDVKVPGSEVITSDEVKERWSSCVAAWGDFQDLEDDQYKDRDGNTRYIGTAASVTLVDPSLIELGG